MNQHINPLACPLCGQSNACALAANDDTPCWCMSSDWTGQLAQAIPPGTPAGQCVCAACAKRLLAARAASPG